MNAKPTTVSVIIPNKNRSTLLRETLDNLLNQTLKPFEIIVVDDGSTEPEYQEVVKDYGSKVVFTKNPKSGPGAARNYGLSLSTGHYIKFCDNDDGLPMVYSPYVYATSESKGNWKQKDIVLTYHPVGEKPFHDYMVRGYFTKKPA
jgi:glycosyltransferase involved in cell wall biosynthesis